ncbi:MAG: hypothetical protein IJV37_06230 [Bacteroidales bacterium]|nr:hypothetical protein [Bacteroidales bacterium]
MLDSLSRQGEPAAVVQFFKAPDAEKPIAFTTTDMDGLNSTTMSGGIYDTGFSYDGTTLTNMTSNAITASATCRSGCCDRHCRSAVWISAGKCVNSQDFPRKFNQLVIVTQ